MVRSVNSMSVFQNMKTTVTPRNVTSFRGDDKNVTSAKNTNKNPNKIGYFRALFSRLTNEQIKNANETGKVEGKIKIKPDGNGGYKIVSNLMNVTTGTQTIPTGYELRKNWLGFTKVLPKDSNGILIKKNK